MTRKIIKIAMAAVISAALSMPAYARDMVQVRGSDTMVNLVQRLAEVYMQNNPGEYVAVTGGGSGGGIAGLMNKTVDIGNASRDMQPKEITNALAKGVEPVRVVIGMDCITVVVNSGNKVDKLTSGQLGAIFRGEITNWSEVGGDDMPITLYGRQSNSGTFVFFREAILKGDYSDKMNRMNGNSQIVEALKNDITGIGYIGLGHAKNASGLKIVKLASREGADYADPTNSRHVDGGKYPIVRTLNQYVAGKPQGAVRDFIKFELSPEAQKIVEDMGFLRVPEEYREYNRENAGV